MGSIVKPYTVFDKSVLRAENLLQLHEDGCELEECDDLIRAAVIISVSGFDRYFTAKYCDVFVPFVKEGKKISDETYERLAIAGLDARFAIEELIVADRPFRKIRTIVQKSLSDHTTHRDDAIDELFLGINLKNLSSNAEKRAKRKNLRKRIEKLVNLRNSIAHEAHVKTNGETKSIDREDIRGRIKDMKLFVKNCDEIIDNKFGIRPAISG